MDPQFQELATQIANDVTQKVTIAVTASVSETVTASVTQAVNAHVTEVVTAAEKRLAEQAKANAEAFTAAEKRLADQAKVNVEAVKAEARLAAEGYGGVLQSIDDRLGRLEANLAQNFGLYDAVLKNHRERITVLEQKSQ